MGRSENQDDLGDAAALTPSLFLGHYLPHIDHLWLDAPERVPSAVEHIQYGGSVLTADPGLAISVMINLGLPLNGALEKIERATHVIEAPIAIEERQ